MKKIISILVLLTLSGAVFAEVSQKNTSPSQPSAIVNEDDGSNVNLNALNDIQGDDDDSMPNPPPPAAEEEENSSTSGNHSVTKDDDYN